MLLLHAVLNCCNCCRLKFFFFFFLQYACAVLVAVHATTAAVCCCCCRCWVFCMLVSLLHDAADVWSNIEACVLRLSKLHIVVVVAGSCCRQACLARRMCVLAACKRQPEAPQRPVQQKVILSYLAKTSASKQKFNMRV